MSLLPRAGRILARSSHPHGQSLLWQAAAVVVVLVVVVVVVMLVVVVVILVLVVAQVVRLLEFLKVVLSRGVYCSWRRTCRR